MTAPWIYCPNCGAVTGRADDPEADFCPVCGYELNAAEYAAQRRRWTPEDELERHKKAQKADML
jgi:uncharacterized Zn finger protein (UPF0148 family)